MIFDTLALLTKERLEKPVSQIRPYDICQIMASLEAAGSMHFDYELVRSGQAEIMNPQIAFLKHYIWQVLSNTKGMATVDNDMVNEELYRVMVYRQTGHLPPEYDCTISSSSSSSRSSSHSSSSRSNSSSSSRSRSSSSCSSSSSSYSHPNWGIYRVSQDVYENSDCSGTVVSTSEDCVWVYDPSEYPQCYDGIETTILSGPYISAEECFGGSASSSSCSASSYSSSFSSSSCSSSFSSSSCSSSFSSSSCSSSFSSSSCSSSFSSSSCSSSSSSSSSFSSSSCSSSFSSSSSSSSLDYPIDNNTKSLLHLDNNVNDNSCSVKSVSNTNVTFSNSSPVSSGFNYYAVFNGSAYLTMPNDSDLRILTSLEKWVFECRFRTTASAAGSHNIIGCYTGDSGNYFQLINDNNYQRLHWSANGNDDWIINDSSINDGNWHHLAVVASLGAWYVYLDGSRKINGSAIISYPNPPAGTSIGSYGGGNNWVGDMDEIRFIKGTDNGWTGATISVPSNPYSNCV